MKKLTVVVAASFVFILLLLQLVLADTVYLKDGRKFTGKVTRNGDRIEVETGYGRLVIDKSEISRIEKSDAPASKPPATAPVASGDVRKAVLESITSSEMTEHIHYLASNLLEGRGTGDQGGKLACDYVTKQFKSYGLKPGGDTQTYTQQFPTRYGDSWNVIGYVEGSDPVMKNQVVVIGAHYDHLGKGKYGSRAGFDGKDKIHPGADDNASGTAGVLEIAQAFAEKGLTPKRTVVFICFGAEEVGLVGSRYYCEHPRFPLENTVAMLNMDMIARNEPDNVTAFGITFSKQLDELLDQANHSHMTINKRSMIPNSDHYSFYAKGVPAVFIHSGMHQDLHMPTDLPYKCDFKKAERIAELVAMLAVGVADYGSKIAMEKPREGESPWGRRRRGPRLGITPGPADLDKASRDKFGLDEEDSAVVIERVSSDSIAEKGGIKRGDILIELGDKNIPSEDQGRWFRKVITTAQKEKKLSYTVIRDGEIEKGTLTFP